MANINIDHWIAYLTMLREVELSSLVPIHFDNVRDVLWIESKGTYSHEAPVVGCVALGDPGMMERADNSGMFLFACAAGFPQPDRVGFSEATLALKIAKECRNENGKREFVYKLHYDLFPSGRRVLEMAGLRLDNDARLSEIRTDSFQRTVRALASAVPEYHRLVTALVETFPDNRDHRVVVPKRQAMAELVVA